MKTERSEILSQLGSAATPRTTERLRRFSFVPPAVLERLAKEALNEEWGERLFVLEKYLSVHVAWSIEQGRFTTSENQLYISAGHLQTRYGTPLYLVFEENKIEERQPWYLTAAGSRISAPELPVPAEIPSPPIIKPGAEIVMSHEHILGENTDRVTFLKNTPPVSQMCAVAGAIQWSLNRGIQIAYWYYGRMNFVVPLYLTSREDITRAPDLVAPIEVSENMLLVRTVLLPHMPYANARLSVKRHDQLPPWLLDCWKKESAKMAEPQLEDPESV